MRLYLVRHGETEWNKLGKFQGRTDVALNERGLSQARESAQAAAAWGPAAVYASPLARTMQVAEEICRAAPVPLHPRPGLMELSLGDLEGVTGAEIRAGWPEVYAQWRDHPAQVVMPHGESLGQLQERAWAAIEEIEAGHAADPAVVAVSHNFAIRTIICALLGVPLANFHRMSLSLGSLCVIDSDGNGRRLITYNCTAHLSAANR